MIDTPPRLQNRPEGNGLTWADVQAQAQADLWFACLFELGPAPTVAAVREWYAKRRPVFRFAGCGDDEAPALRGWPNWLLATFLGLGFFVVVRLVTAATH